MDIVREEAEDLWVAVREAVGAGSTAAAHSQPHQPHSTTQLQHMSASVCVCVCVCVCICRHNTDIILYVIVCMSVCVCVCVCVHLQKIIIHDLYRLIRTIRTRTVGIIITKTVKPQTVLLPPG